MSFQSMERRNRSRGIVGELYRLPRLGKKRAKASSLLDPFASKLKNIEESAERRRHKICGTARRDICYIGLRGRFTEK